MSDTYRDAIRKHGKRDRFARGFPVKVGMMPVRIGPLRPFTGWSEFRFTRDYLPGMATPDGRRWWSVAVWHRLQLGPLVVMWRRPR